MQGHTANVLYRVKELFKWPGATSQWHPSFKVFRHSQLCSPESRLRTPVIFFRINFKVYYNDIDYHNNTVCCSFTLLVTLTAIVLQVRVKTRWFINLWRCVSGFTAITKFHRITAAFDFWLCSVTHPYCRTHQVEKSLEMHSVCDVQVLVLYMEWNSFFHLILSL